MLDFTRATPFILNPNPSFCSVRKGNKNILFPHIRSVRQSFNQSVSQSSSGAVLSTYTSSLGWTDKTRLTYGGTWLGSIDKDE